VNLLHKFRTNLPKNSCRKVVIVEFSSHYFSVQQLAFLFQEDFEVEFCFRLADGSAGWREMFDGIPEYRSLSPSSLVLGNRLRRLPGGRLVARAVADLLFLSKALHSGFFGKKIFISTGPENRGVTGILFFSLIVFLFDDVMLNVRDARFYRECLNADRFPDFRSRILGRALRRITFVSFETDTVRNSMVPEFWPDAQGHVIYSKFSDFSSPVDLATVAPDPWKLRIGLLGTLSRERRDYSVVLGALRTLTPEQLAKISFTVLSGVPGDAGRGILSELSALVSEVHWRVSLPESDLLEIGQSCDYVLAPLKAEFGYGRLKGSGAIGDALVLRKRLIWPANCDPAGEFHLISEYYRDEQQLGMIFLDLLAGDLNVMSRARDYIFDDFSSKSARTALKQTWWA